MLSIQTHTRTHTWTYTPSLPPFSFLRFSSFVGLSLRLFRWFLRLVSLPQSRAKYSFFHFSTPIFLSCPLSAALSFFLLFLRLFRYLFRFLTRAPPSGTVCVCVCVSHPVPKGSTSRGHRPIVDTCANEAVPRWGMRRLITSVYLLNFWTSCHPTFPRFDSCFFMFPPPNLGFAAELRRSFTTAEFCSQGKQPLLKHLQFLGPFTVLFHRHPSHRGNCVN